LIFTLPVKAMGRLLQIEWIGFFRWRVGKSKISPSLSFSLFSSSSVNLERLILRKSFQGWLVESFSTVVLALARAHGAYHNIKRVIIRARGTVAAITSPITFPLELNSRVQPLLVPR
jgi:hypothetical protein